MTHAVVMAGGGAAAAFEVGVLLAMDRRGIKVDAVYGTSAGALNAACYAFSSAEKLVELWSGIRSWRDLWSLNYTALAGFGSGIMNSKPLLKKIDRICKGTPKIRCCVTKVDLRTGVLEYCYAGDRGFNASVEASAAFPGIVSPVGGFTDGGVREVCPLNRAIHDGHDHISVILCNQTDVGAWKPSSGFLGFLGVAMRVNDIRGNEVLRNDISAAIRNRSVDVTVYEPSRDYLGLIDFDKDLIARAIEAGVRSDGTCFTRD
jgi:NTE family protein